MLRSGLYQGTVRHFRFKPTRHQLRYRVYNILLDTDEISDLAASSRVFSRNKFNLFSFYDSDHGSGKPDDIASWVREQLTQADIRADGKIFILCYPRLLGYAFNPITVYYCFDAAQNPVAILYAVRNTFGGRHAYLFPVEIPTDGAVGMRINQYTDKLLHVSPFIDMAMQYQFSLKLPGEEASLAIKVSDADGPLLNTSFGGRYLPLTDRALLDCFWRYPLMTAKVVAGIHWEALKLMAKGMRLRAGAPDPSRPVTVIRQ